MPTRRPAQGPGARRRRPDDLLARLALAVGAAPDLDTALARLLRDVCRETGWTYGEAWLPDASGSRLLRSPVWFGRRRALERLGRSPDCRSFSRGQGLPGRVWATGQARWYGSVAEVPHFARRTIARELGLETAFAVAVKTGDRVAAVLAFFGDRPSRRDPAWLDRVRSAAALLGPLLARRRSDDALHERAAAELYEGEERFRAFLDNGLAVAWLKRENGTYVYVNRAFLAAVRRPAEDVIGRTAFDFLPGEVAEEMRGEEVTVLQGDRAVESVATAPDPDGRPRRWLLLRFPFRDVAGQRYIGGMALDVTEREEALRDLAASESRARAVLETAADAIVTMGEEGAIGSFNPAAERLFGWRAPEVLGKPVALLMPSPHRERHDEYLARYHETGVARIIGIGREVECVRRDGTTFPAFLSVGEATVDGRRLYTGIVRDLTAEKRLREEVVRNGSLAAVGELVSVVAHEVKNPLAAISAVVHNLRRSLPDGDGRRGSLDDVLAEVSRLDGKVREILLAARPWTAKKEPLEVRPLLDRLLGLARSHQELARARLRVEGGDGIVIPLDAGLLEQAFWNLVLNAAQASPAGVEIVVAVQPAPSGIRIRFSDDGPGLPPVVRERLFEPFVTTKPGGSGLGLTVCRKVAEAHGGRIEIESGPSRGTAVTLSFPRDA